MQDIEFTIQRGQALDAADAHRQAHRARRGADRRRDGEGGADLAARRRSLRVDPRALDQLLHPTLDPERRAHGDRARACRRRRAPPSAASSSPPTTPRRAPRRARRSSSCASRPRPRTSTACTPREGILTARGGMTSHAAVVARGMGKCCVAGCGALRIDYATRRAARRRPRACARATRSPSTARPAR